MRPRIQTHPDRDGVRIVDPIQNVQFSLYTPDPVEPAESEPGTFHFPVDTAAHVDAERVVVPKLVGVYVRTTDGEFVGYYDPNKGPLDLESDSYTLELDTSSVKLYLVADSGLAIRRTEAGVEIEFDGRVNLAVGARSFHDRPAGTITATAGDVEDAMAAVSHLGSALKTLSPERSFPTLRGHPPLVEAGDRFAVPDGIEPPDTGVTIEIPPEWERLYPVVSLAYYLGARVVPGREPRLLADDLARPLDGDEGFERTVTRTLRQTLFFDCVTRTEGYYRVDLHERNAVEPLVDFDFADLYDRPVAEQVATYLRVPFDRVAEYVLDWNLTTDIVPDAESLEVLPYVANDLSLVRCPSTLSEGTFRSEPPELTEFYRAPNDDERDDAEDVSRRPGGPRQDAATGPDPSHDRRSLESNVVQPDPVETVEHAWVGDGYPLGANKVTADAYRRGLDRAPVEESQIEVQVVCNDEAMREEGIVSELYGLRDLVQFEVTIDYDLTTDELRDLLAESADFLHYVGHVSEEGIQCADGFLDARTLDEVNVDAFLLNACQSYRQGQHIVDRGSYAGVVTLAEVTNSVATRMGRTIARLLNSGFTFRSAVSIAQDQSLTGYRYVVVGDGGMTLVQSDGPVPTLLEITPDGRRYEVEMWSFPVPGYGLGTFVTPWIDGVSARYLASGSLDTFSMSREELDAFLDLEVIPVRLEDDLYWSDDVDVASL